VIESEALFSIEGIIQPITQTDTIKGYPVIGSDADLPALLKKTRSAIITVGQIKTVDTRLRLFNLLKELGADLPLIISPYAYCSKHAKVNEGTIIMHGSIINYGVKVGSNCIINSHALIEHDACISNHCHISTGAKINGGAKIGQGVFIGSGAVIREGVAIGEGAIIGAGQVVLRDVSAGVVLKKTHG
jgi:sugar O-acyltransferase (sialic acid O-acetyltransferase NeuD family)